MQPLGHGDPQQLGGHRLVGVLGRGGQGSVYLGEGANGVRAAVKMLHGSVEGDDDAHRRFVREADAARRVAPFCTAKVLEVGIADQRPYIVSEFIPGVSLDVLVKNEGPRSGSGLMRLAVATLTALAAIHRAGIVHRDFKPSNVIMGPEGPVVIDFGIARALDHTTTHGVLGTPAFMAPEQFEGVQLTPAADVFSWAVTMVFAATGHSAFAGDSMPSLMHAILTREPDLSGVPAELGELLAACLAKSPAARPGATDLLGRLTGDDRPHHPPPAPSAPGRQPPPPAPGQSPPGQPPAGQFSPPGWGPPPPRTPAQVGTAAGVIAALAAGAAALVCLLHALMTWRGLVTHEYELVLDWSGWEALRLGVLSLAAPAIFAALLRVSRAPALVVLLFIPAFLLHIAYVYGMKQPEMPQMLVGVLGGVVQGVVVVTVGALTWRWSKVGSAVALAAGACFLLENVMWIAATEAELETAETLLNLLSLEVGLGRVLAAVWLVLLGIGLARRAVQTR